MWANRGLRPIWPHSSKWREHQMKMAGAPSTSIFHPLHFSSPTTVLLLKRTKLVLCYKEDSDYLLSMTRQKHYELTCFRLGR